MSLFDLGPFRRLCVNLTMCKRALFPKTATILVLVEQAFRRMPSFAGWVIASSSEVILARPSRHSAAGAFTSGTSGPRWFSLTLLHERILRRIWWWTFPTLIHIVAETAIVSFHTLPVGFPLPTISKNSLYTLFCPLILDHGVLLKIFASGSKVLISNFLLNTSLHQSFQSCDNQVVTSSDESPGRTIPIRSWALSNSWISSFRRLIVNRSV